ncbi:hypothetical protein KC351_g18039 [Hortaea werneckii]|nr:hypothetical protein KC351_g18039 [Hortaea werneckii]
MAGAATPQDNTSSMKSDDSDYGSDLDEATVDALFSQPEPQPSVGPKPGNIEQPVIVDDHGDDRPLARLARIRDSLTAAIVGLDSTSDTLKAAHQQPKTSIELEYAEDNRSAFSLSRPSNDSPEPEPSVESSSDTRTPIQRFRTPPKKPLSVTDIISPAWCELQYWYNLTRYGRVRATKAMKQGSSVHKVLEEQVHTEVPVEVQTKEDRFALRIWNIITGLRTLRRTGMTREMEVWGVVEGEVVNGIIDQITTTSPDEIMEAQMLEEAENAKSGSASRGKKRKPLSSDQRTLTDYMTSSQTGSILESGRGLEGWLGTLHERPPNVYLIDVKTRQSKSLPPQGSQTRLTYYQLMMYHRLFSALATNGVDAERIFERYKVQPDKTFSDTFIAQMSTFDTGADVDLEEDEWVPHDASQDSVSELLAHNSLAALWSLMMQEFQKAVPANSVSSLLTAEYRATGSGDLMGKRSFVFDAERLDAYVQDEMRWWKGERETKGVEIEEAFKCQICEFAPNCTWRNTKVEEGLQKAKLKKEKRQKSEV